MTYLIIFSDYSFKQLEKLPKDIQKRIISTLKRIRIRPYSYVIKLVASNYYRLRVGEYRIILNIKNNELQIYVIELGHRKNIYK
ncbi:MAG: type II toxin-antitoxin system RelE/ParE family toxin [Nanoarchaeota archaeon]|nr:type II toxin-antitoxin system RelE/ParE family toxin [Nanoarchaeota archaeon]